MTKSLKANTYFKKNKDYIRNIVPKCENEIALIIVIPAFNESKILTTLYSLQKNVFQDFVVEVIIVVNKSEIANESVSNQNKLCIEEIEKFKLENDNSNLKIYYLNEILTKKHAGVGLARKIGMDTASNRFDSIGKNGIIVCLDADCTVQNNYIQSIYNHFYIKNQDTGACSIYFEHPLSGNIYPKENYMAIQQYELFLRYYKLSLKYCGFRYAYHTVGSSMACTVESYIKQGGMNKRKAGEDFYFIQKIAKLDNYFELNDTTVFPSPRVSDRVPFGTGKAIGEIVSVKNEDYKTYNFQSFIDLEVLFSCISQIYKDEICIFSEAITDYLNRIDFKSNIRKIKVNVSSYEAFEKRFFDYFDGFMIMKYLHFCRDNYYANRSIETEVNQLMRKMKMTAIQGVHSQLLKLRGVERRIKV